MSDAELRLAVVGCGAVARIGFLPALRTLGLRPALLVDSVRSRAEDLAAAFGGTGVGDWHECLQGIDAAVVALPHSLHALVSCELLAAGVHVLVEKPMATTCEQCAAMIDSARASGAVLAVGQLRRFQHGLRWVRAALAAGLLGRLEDVDVREGLVYNWPVASDSFFRREVAGGGVLLDTGAHVLDLLTWWLGRLEVVEYRDDACGGVEADCQVRLALPAGGEVAVELSRTRNLRNTVLIRGRRGQIEVGLHDNQLRLRPRGLRSFRIDGMGAGSLPAQDYVELFVPEVSDFLGAVSGCRAPAVSGSDVEPSIALIEACYARRVPLDLPWTRVPVRSEGKASS